MLYLIFAILSVRGFAETPLQMKEEIEKSALTYFVEQADPKTGLVRDRASNFSPTPASNTIASITTTGFAISVIANAASRGLIGKQFAVEYIRKVLKFCSEKVPRYKGWFVHFMDMHSGARVGESEFSTIDTAIFLAGALYAADILDDSEIKAIAYRLYDEADFNAMMTHNGALAWKRMISMGYTPESGFILAQWGIYAEQMVLLILGLGHRKNPLPQEVWTAWLRQPSFNGIMGYSQPLFIHQYSQLFLDLRKFSDGYDNYYQNSIKASFLSRGLSFGTEKYWGMSAGDSVDGYQVFGPVIHKSTVCIGCAVGSAQFISKEVLEDAIRWRQSPSSGKLWGRYGFVDSIDPENKWYDKDVIGITVASEYLSLANLDLQNSIWHTFMNIPEVKLGLRRASQVGH